VIGRLRSRAQRLRQTLWALVIAPTVWALHFLFCYVYAAIRCAKGGRTELLGDVRLAVAIATIIALATVVASGFVAWAQSLTEGDPPPHQESTDEDRLRFLAVATLLLAGLSFIAIVFTAIPAFIFEDCR
jgi:nitrate reductase NapE component